MIQHYRGEEFIQKIEPVTAFLKRALMGPFLLEVEVADITSLVVGDLLKIEHLNETFTFRIREIKEKQITAEHISYVLTNYAVIDKYFNTPPTYDDFIEFADVTLDDLLNGFLAPLLNDAGFSVVNNSSSNDMKDITFQSDNLLSAIQKIADTFKVEFLQHDTYIEFVDQMGVDRDLTINAGVESDKVVKKIDRSHIVTRVYPVGSSDNLPDGYYYTNLKPTTFDLATKTHSGNVYVDNTEGINTYGIIEKIVEFPDIKIQSRRGTVDSAGEDYLSEYDKNYPYIYDPALSDIDESKALSATLFIVDGLKAAELRIVKASATDKRIYYSKTLKDGSELSWTPSNGSKYILVGYITQAEIDKARAELIEAAQDYLNKHSAPKVSYEIQRIYLGDFDFDIGDSLKIKDDNQGINDTVRVVEFTKDLIKNVYTSLKFSNVIEKIPYEFLKEQYEQKQRLKKISNAVSNSVQTAREALERHNLLVRNNFYGSENEYVLIGSEARNYALKGLTITPDDGASGKVSWTDFEFQEILDNTPYQCGEGNVQLSQGTYYLFIQIQKNDFANSGGQNKLVFSQTKLENSGDLIYYALGMAEFDGTRTKVATSYGFTLIDGSFIKTGTLVADKITTGILMGSTGTTKFDLDNDVITVGTDLVKIGKGVLSDGSNGVKIINGSIEIDGGQLRGTDNKTVIDLDNDLIDVGNGLVRIGKNAINKTIQSARVETEPFGAGGNPDIHYYASVDGENWQEITELQSSNIADVPLFVGLPYDGRTVYLKVKALGSDGGEDGAIYIYFDNTNVFSSVYNISVPSITEIVFPITLPNYSDGIYINAGNLKVNGEISTKYLKLENSAIIDLSEYVDVAYMGTTFLGRDFPIDVWQTFTMSTTSILATETLITAQGTKQYLKNVPIKLNIFLDFDTYGYPFKAYYQLYYGGSLIYTSPTKGFSTNIDFNDYHNFYALATPSSGKELLLKVYFMPQSSYENELWINSAAIRVPKTMYIVHAID